MNYKLCVLRDDENYKVVDLSTIFNDKKKIYDLESIDEFTMSFEDENALKKELLSSGVIKEEDLNKSLCIKYGDKNIRQTDIMYSNNKELVLNIKNLSISIKKYYNENKKAHDFYKSITGDFQAFEAIFKDRVFLKKLREYAYQKDIPNLNTREIVVYINTSTNHKQLYIALYDLLKKIFYKYDLNKNDLRFSYKSLRDFCLFFSGYKIPHKNSEKQNDYDSKLDFYLPHDSFKEKINPEDFPPNSFEEEMYGRYLEELEEGFAPDPDSYFSGKNFR